MIDYADPPTDAEWRHALAAVGWAQHNVRDHTGEVLPDGHPQLSVWVLSDPYRGVPVVEVRDSLPEVTLEAVALWFRRLEWQLRLDLLDTGWQATCSPYASATVRLLPDGFGTPMVCRQITALSAAVALLVLLDQALNGAR